MSATGNDSPSDPAAAPADDHHRRTQPLNTDGYSQYLLHAHGEVVFVLNSLLHAVSQITVFFNEGQDMLLTTLVAVDDRHVVLDYGASSEINRKVVAADKHFCVASLDKVRIQFILRAVEQIDYEGRPAFRAELPGEVLRLQRREFFRLTMPITRPLKCVVPIVEANGSTFTHELNVVDISGGGLSIAVPQGTDFRSGTEFKKCRLELPEIGTLTTDLVVRNQFEITLKSGGQVKRAGCEFVKLPSQMATLVQRYIIKVERERKARESGLG